MTRLPPAVGLDDFDVAAQAGLREELAAVYREFRSIQANSQSGLDEPGQIVARQVCPGCGAATRDTTLLFSKNNIPHVRCNHCDLVYTLATLTPSADAAQYDGNEFMRAYVELKRHPLYAKLEIAKARYLLQRVQAQRAGVRTVLDIGASTGAMMAAAGLQGLDGYGIEPDRAMAELLGRLYPQRLINGYFPQDLSQDWPLFDLITLLDVLEHMVEPVCFLESIKASLGPEGVLLVQVPNFNSLLVQMDGPKNSNFCIGHWQHFTAATLSALLARAGFCALEIGNCISELDRIRDYPATQVLTTTARLLGEAKTVETPAQLYEYGLGYKLYGLFALTSS
ncbi:MAG: class I SAM-dependent methyltransferase [Rhodocyclaceae bacterium]|jgi:uncharacterized metal-binding protein (TIGR02443 family)|nr:class I SAM-dependent methyltransferase [Rhodocyclaceae bacterium]